MFYFTRAVTTAWAFLQGTLGMFLCVIQIQGEMELDAIELEVIRFAMPLWFRLLCACHIHL